MVEDSELFIGLDVSKDSHAIAVAEGGRDGDLREATRDERAAGVLP